VTPPTLRARLAAAAAAWFASSAVDARTPLALERERYLFFHPATGLYNRYVPVVPAIVVQMVLGSFYSTSVFNKRNDHDVWSEPGVNARMFVACVASYGACAALLGAWVGRNGVFASVARAAVLTPLGWAAASLAVTTRTQALLYVYGACHGAGCALSYISTTSCLAQWYPESKGLAAGVAVFGAGLGSYVWTLTARALMDPAGAALAPASVMALFAALFAALLAAALPLLRNPPPGWAPPPPPAELAAAAGAACAPRAAPAKAAAAAPDREYTFITAVATREFALTAAVIFATSLPGVVFLSSAADMASNVFGLNAQDAALVTSYLNLTNFLGRLGWGAVTDVIGRKSFFLLSAALQAAALAAMATTVRAGAYSAWLASFLVVGSLYGGGFGVLPAFCAELWGPKASSATHGALVAVWAVACVVGAPVFAAVNAASAVRDASGARVPAPAGYATNATWLACLPGAAILAVAFLDVRADDRRAARASGACRVRAGGLVLACSRARGVALLGAAAQAREFAACGALGEGGAGAASEEGAAREVGAARGEGAGAGASGKGAARDEDAAAAGLREWGVEGAVRGEERL
jgi:MFS family permease